MRRVKGNLFVEVEDEFGELHTGEVRVLPPLEGDGGQDDVEIAWSR